MFLMRRFLLALTGTIAGLAALLSFKSASSGAGTTAAAATGGSSASASASASSSTGTASTNGSGTAAGASPSSGTGTATGTATTTGKTVTGTVAQTNYGPMQVQISVQGKKIVAVKVLQQTDTGATSQQIDANAIPQLTKETLTAQSAKVSAVSGASYTSSGYIKSLQSALDKI
jgi:uncharacterized protein with FMN-binding domain